MPLRRASQPAIRTGSWGMESARARTNGRLPREKLVRSEPTPPRPSPLGPSDWRETSQSPAEIQERPSVGYGPGGVTQIRLGPGTKEGFRCSLRKWRAWGKARLLSPGEQAIQDLADIERPTKKRRVGGLIEKGSRTGIGVGTHLNRRGHKQS